MPGKVADASVVAALLYGEPERLRAAEMLSGADLFAPAHLPYEIGNICLKKIRKDPERRAFLVAGHRQFDDFGIQLLPVERGAVLALSERLGLTFYDAAYLWLAQDLGAELVTFDKRLQAAAQA